MKKEKILGIINCPVSKEYLFKNKYQGITEYISRLSGYKGKEVMLIYNKELAVSPITTHIPVSQINKKINQSEINARKEHEKCNFGGIMIMLNIVFYFFLMESGMFLCVCV